MTFSACDRAVGVARVGQVDVGQRVAGELPAGRGRLWSGVVDCPAARPPRRRRPTSLRRHATTSTMTMTTMARHRHRSAPHVGTRRMLPGFMRFPPGLRPRSFSAAMISSSMRQVAPMSTRRAVLNPTGGRRRRRARGSARTCDDPVGLHHRDAVRALEARDVAADVEALAEQRAIASSTGQAARGTRRGRWRSCDHTSAASRPAENALRSRPGSARSRPAAPRRPGGRSRPAGPDGGEDPGLEVPAPCGSAAIVS